MIALIFFIIFHEHIPCTQSIKFFFCCKHHSTQQARICFICGYCIVVHHFFNGTSFIIYGVVFPLLMWEFTLHISLVQFFYGFILVPFLVLDSFHFMYSPIFTAFSFSVFFFIIWSLSFTLSLSYVHSGNKFINLSGSLQVEICNSGLQLPA